MASGMPTTLVKLSSVLVSTMVDCAIMPSLSLSNTHFRRIEAQGAGQLPGLLERDDSLTLS